MELNKLCLKSIEILKQTKTRRSAQSVFDVFYQMWADGYFDGYGMVELIKDEFGFGPYFYEHGNAEVYSNVKTWYKEQYGSRNSNQTVKVVEVSVGDLLEETDKAYGFDGGKIHRQGHPVVIWVPKSQVEYDNKNQTLVMPIWLAKEKNWMQTR